MESVFQNIIIVVSLCHLLEASQQDFVLVVGDNVELVFDAKKTTFEEAILTVTSSDDYSERSIVVDGAVVANKYRVKERTAERLSIAVDSVHFSEAGNYAYTFNGNTISVARVTVLDPKPNCTFSKQTKSNGLVSGSFEYMLLECTFTYSGSLAPAVKWTEDALIDIGVSSSSCKASAQNVNCKIPIRFDQAPDTDALEDTLPSGSSKAIATSFDGCIEHKCYWERDWSTAGLGYSIRMDGSKTRFLGTLQCYVIPCRILKRAARSTNEKVEVVDECKMERTGLIGAVIALSLIVVVLGSLMTSSCIKNQYLKRRIDFYIDTEHHKRSQLDNRLTQSASPLAASESRPPVQLLSFRSIDQPNTYVEAIHLSPPADELIHGPATEPVVLPPMPRPSRRAPERRSHSTRRENEPSVSNRTVQDPSRNSEPPMSSANDYVKLTQREPIQLPVYAALSQEQRAEHVAAKEQDPESNDSYVNVKKKTRRERKYVNVSEII